MVSWMYILGWNAMKLEVRDGMPFWTSPEYLWSLNGIKWSPTLCYLHPTGCWRFSYRVSCRRRGRSTLQGRSESVRYIA